jgi:hypothetical protein
MKLGPGSAPHHFAALVRRRVRGTIAQTKNAALRPRFRFERLLSDQYSSQGVSLNGSVNGPGSAVSLVPKTVLSSTLDARWFGDQA